MKRISREKRLWCWRVKGLFFHPHTLLKNSRFMLRYIRTTYRCHIFSSSTFRYMDSSRAKPKVLSASRRKDVARNCVWFYGFSGVPLLYIKHARVADPHHFNADPDPSFHLSTDPDQDPAPHQSDAYLRPLVYRPSMSLFLWATTALHGYVWSLFCSIHLSLIWIQIRIHFSPSFPKIMRIRIRKPTACFLFRSLKHIPGSRRQKDYQSTQDNPACPRCV